MAMNTVIKDMQEVWLKHDLTQNQILQYLVTAILSLHRHHHSKCDSDKFLEDLKPLIDSWKDKI